MSNTPRVGKGRRAFLRRVAVAGGAATVAAAGGGALAGAVRETPENNNAKAEPTTKGYRVTSHIETYYRLARF